ncbi:putative 3-octaprenyl-4-hydroxybenzoate carboxy-lyase [uncultured Desulfobacterium sp.]|uniref:Putative 3-octaprenyl-4-hydroxybenzoate carboxy-lyase n=1 Tax=uncultured Desulfobacterium sp. TaxID=201089 RepID=A0A445MW63_9BACT|nr:putative 3-octaprenyl-4-hydroxybenzoate carboxy-lyase [uncultured Desulfobacterium sp.]
MSHKDLREFIGKLEAAGELHRIKTQVDWDLELSAIMRKVFEKDGPACLFENVKGSDFPVFSGGFYKAKKYGIAVGAPPDIRSILKKMLRATENPIPPVMVSNGPCKENIDLGDKINLEKFPVPKWFHLDGGRYIGTLGTIITKDPDTGIRNMGVYRQQIAGKNRLGMLATQQCGINLQKHRIRKIPMPIVTAIGVPPSVLAAAIVRAPYGEDELGIAGGIMGEPIPLVKCETVDLEVPANSEIVIEGEIPPDADLWVEEGPFGEFTGYCSSVHSEIKPVVNVTAVTYRNNPIFQGCSPGIPPNEETTFREIGSTVGAWRSILKAAVPGVKEVYATEMGCAEFVIVVSMDQQYYMGNAREVIEGVFATVGKTTKWVIVVDDDIDIFDRGQVEWALSVRVQPHRDIIITDDRHSGNPLDPSIHPSLRRHPLLARTSRIGIDATTKNKDFDFPPLVKSTEEMERLVEKRWREYGFI